MSTCKRRDCGMPATFDVYAAYDLGTGVHESHPRLARYPMPMARVCGFHLADALGHDGMTPMSTQQWVVRPHGG
jgi:hypothetical protein